MRTPGCCETHRSQVVSRNVYTLRVVCIIYVGWSPMACPVSFLDRSFELLYIMLYTCRTFFRYYMFQICHMSWKNLYIHMCWSFGYKYYNIHFHKNKRHKNQPLILAQDTKKRTRLGSASRITDKSPTPWQFWCAYVWSLGPCHGRWPVMLPLKKRSTRLNWSVRDLDSIKNSSERWKQIWREVCKAGSVY